MIEYTFQEAKARELLEIRSRDQMHENTLIQFWIRVPETNDNYNWTKDFMETIEKCTTPNPVSSIMILHIFILKVM